MASRKVIHTNKYLRDPRVRAAMIFQSTRTSFAVEGIRKPFDKGDLPLANVDRAGVVFSKRAGRR